MSQYDYYYNFELECFDRIPLPRLLFTHQSYKKLTLESKVLYGLLWERTALSVEKGWQEVDGRNFVYFPQQEVQDFFGVSHAKATKMMEELDQKCGGVGLIERKRQGLGLPTKIYVLDFASITTPLQPEESTER